VDHHSWTTTRGPLPSATLRADPGRVWPFRTFPNAFTACGPVTEPNCAPGHRSGSRSGWTRATRDLLSRSGIKGRTVERAQLGAHVGVEWCPVEQPAQPLFEAGDESHRAGYAHEAARSVEDLPDRLGYALGWDLSWLARYPAGARRHAVEELRLQIPEIICNS
jgi:hypothetical protein